MFMVKSFVELKKSFENIDLKNAGSDVVRFVNSLYRHHYYQQHLAEKEVKRRIFTLDKIFQIARMLGMRPSEVLKYSGDLRPHVQLNGIKHRTLLDDEKTQEFLGHVRQRYCGHV